MFWTNLERMMGSFREQRSAHGQGHRLFDDCPAQTAVEFPAVNIWNGPESYILTAEIPGIDAEKLDVAVVGDTVTIRGSRPPPELKEGETYHRGERGHGQFVRSIKLPKPLDADRVEAKYARGILNLRLPRAEAEMPRKIALKTS
ncbi:MAG: Hsp20/alpha crystallin family protein [Candidatus Riflebacteria bacterium]|nr:Hsp20/alpha crystallin family protein [Candidatus Riflebacteria bacterium]